MLATPGSQHRWHSAVAGAEGRGVGGRAGAGGAGLAHSRAPLLPCGAVSSSRVAGIGLPAPPVSSFPPAAPLSDSLGSSPSRGHLRDAEARNDRDLPQKSRHSVVLG